MGESLGFLGVVPGGARVFSGLGGGGGGGELAGEGLEAGFGALGADVVGGLGDGGVAHHDLEGGEGDGDVGGAGVGHEGGEGVAEVVEGGVPGEADGGLGADEVLVEDVGVEGVAFGVAEDGAGGVGAGGGVEAAEEGVGFGVEGVAAEGFYLDAVADDPAGLEVALGPVEGAGVGGWAAGVDDPVDGVEEPGGAGAGVGA